MNENELLARIRELFPRAGDDAAVVGDQVLTSDMLVEGIDFLPGTPAQSIARKSLAVNLSDLAAMGARPLYALVSLAGPDSSFVADLVESFASAARELRVEIVGGDLSSAPQVITSVTAIGHAPHPLLRSGARVHDRIYVSRPLGAPAAGLTLLMRGWPAGDAKASTVPPPVLSAAEASYSQRELGLAAIRRHLEPEPEIELGQRLVGIAGACIDISDGLAIDLHRLCDASGVGTVINRERIPVFPGLVTDGPPLGIDVRKAILNGGEEYALLFTSRLREAEISSRVGRPVYQIGRVTEERAVLLDDQPLVAAGWDHFAR